MTSPAGFPDLPDAACVDVDPERFFAFEPHVVDQARAICHRCPEIRACLTWALAHGEHGVWAGTTEQQRQELATHHRRSHA